MPMLQHGHDNSSAQNYAIETKEGLCPPRTGTLCKSTDLIYLNDRELCESYWARMSAITHELSKVESCICDLERSVTNVQEGRESSLHVLDESDRKQILCMLVKTLEAMKAQRLVLERLGRSY
jgi:hypothetical protein